MTVVMIAAVVTCAALAYVLMVRPKDVPQPVAASPVQHLDDRKQAIYANLRDLQFEYRLGKLSDEDYQQTKQALQKELAGVLAETEATLNRLGLTLQRTAPEPPGKPKHNICKHCGARFAQALKFCGECGKEMA